jgi:hypothetical protein
MSGYYIAGAVLVFLGLLSTAVTAKYRKNSQNAVAFLSGLLYLFLLIYGAVAL